MLFRCAFFAAGISVFLSTLAYSFGAHAESGAIKPGIDRKKARGWPLVHEEEGVRVYRSPKSRGEAVTFRAEGVVYAPFAEVMAVLYDGEGRKEWLPRCKQSRVLLSRGSLRAGTFWTRNYQRFRTPWPIWDRDVVVDIRGRVNFTKRRAVVHFHERSVPTPPVPKRVVRMPKLRGTYEVRGAKNGRTYLRYFVESDAGGSLPRWLIRWLSKSAPAEGVIALREQVKREAKRQVR